MTQLTRLRTVASLERAREYSYRLQQFSFHSCTIGSLTCKCYHVHGITVGTTTDLYGLGEDSYGVVYTAQLFSCRVFDRI